MSSFTPNIHLEKPDKTDKIRDYRLVNNPNFDIIDEEIARIDGKFQHDLGTFATADQVIAAINELNATLNDNDVVAVSFSCTAGIGEPFEPADYGGFFFRSSSTTARIVIAKSGQNEVLNGCRGSSGWTWERNTDYLLMATNGGLAESYGAGAYRYFRLATLTIMARYINSPIVFEVSRRGFGYQTIQVIFQNLNGTDPGVSVFKTDGDETFWIKKIETGKWEIYGKYSEAYGRCTIHRVTGSMYNNGVNVDLNMANIGNDEPVDAIQISNSALPIGGSTGQYLRKKTSDDFDVGWESPANNLTTTAEGFVLDARQGKALKERIDDVDSKLQNNIGTDFSTLASLETALTAFNGTLEDYDVANISFRCISGMPAPFAATAFCGIFARIGATRARVLVMRSGWSPIVEGYYGDSGWIWDQIALTSNLEIEQHVIPASKTSTINSVSTLNSALRDSSVNTMAMDASYRQTLANAGLIPVSSAGTWTVRKLSSGYMFMDYATYQGRKYFANINNNVLSSWTEVASTDDVDKRSRKITLSSDVTTWEQIWAELNVLETGETATIFMHNYSAKIITDNVVTTGSPGGTVTRTTTNHFKFTLVAHDNPSCVRVTLIGATATSPGTITAIDDVYKSVVGSTKAEILANVDALLPSTGFAAGQFNSTVSATLGLTSKGSAHAFELSALSASGRILTATTLTTGQKWTLSKSGTWGSEWQSVAQSIFLRSSDNTWEEVYAKIRIPVNGYTTPLYCNNTALNVLTNGALTAGAPSGFLCWTSNTACQFLFKQTSNHLYLGTLTVTAEGAFSSWTGRYLFDESYATYKAGESIALEQGITCVATTAKDGYYGSVALARPVASGVTVTLRAGWTEYGHWYSDGGSHTIDKSAALTGTAKNNAVWFKIPVSGIQTSTNNIAWFRLSGTLDFT